MVIKFRKMKFLIALLSSCIISTFAKPDSCPVIHAKSANECSGKISECWSPGQLDVDCNNGKDLCCFNGCVNVCHVPVCETVMETRYENVTKEECREVPQEPVCTDEQMEDCWDSCKTIDEVHPKVIEEEVCKPVVEPVCNNVEMEVCSPPPIQTAATTCPLIHAKPASDCLSHPPSDCWSPGVLDLDCDNGTGLCCFDGCYNRCVKNCPKESYEVCNTVEEKVCKDVPSGRCWNVEAPVQVPMVTRTCSHMERACMTMASVSCSGENLGNCKEVADTQCSEATPEECTMSTVFVEKLVPFKKCEAFNTVDCKNVPKETCRTEVREVCPKCIQTKVTIQKCEDVSHTVCNTVPKIVETIVPKNVCSKVCQPRVEKVCDYLPSKRVCNDVVSFRTFKVPVTKCG